MRASCSNTPCASTNKLRTHRYLQASSGPRRIRRMAGFAPSKGRAQVRHGGARRKANREFALRVVLRRPPADTARENRTHRRCGHQGKDSPGGGEPRARSIPLRSNSRIRAGSNHGVDTLRPAIVGSVQGGNPMEGRRCIPHSIAPGAERSRSQIAILNGSRGSNITALRQVDR